MVVEHLTIDLPGRAQADLDRLRLVGHDESERVPAEGPTGLTVPAHPDALPLTLTGHAQCESCHRPFGHNRVLVDPAGRQPIAIVPHLRQIRQQAVLGVAESALARRTPALDRRERPVGRGDSLAGARERAPPGPRHTAHDFAGLEVAVLEQIRRLEVEAGIDIAGAEASGWVRRPHDRPVHSLCARVAAKPEPPAVAGLHALHSERAIRKPDLGCPSIPGLRGRRLPIALPLLPLPRHIPFGVPHVKPHTIPRNVEVVLIRGLRERVQEDLEAVLT